MNDINIIAVTAWPAAGKSVASREIVGQLTRHGFDVDFYSDKEALLKQIEDEISQAGKSLDSVSPIEVENFVLLNPSQPRESWGIKFKRSFTLNEAHRKLNAMLRQQALRDGRSKTVVELAYGENAAYPDGNLRQNARDYLDQFEELGILDSTVFLNIFARFKHRRRRNIGRKAEVGYIPDEEFRKYFKDRGGWTKEDRDRLNGRFKRIDNELFPKWAYELIVRETARRFIVPLVRGEGQAQFEEGQRRTGHIEM